MHKLATRKDMTYSVDWLTEVVRRVSDAHRTNKGLETVNMRTPMRSEKVCALCYIAVMIRSAYILPPIYVQWKKHETRYTDREWNHDEIAAFEDGISQFGAELRSVRDEIGTRSMPDVVRFYGKWKKQVLFFLLPLYDLN